MHRDVKPGNVLVHTNGTIKIAGQHVTLDSIALYESFCAHYLLENASDLDKGITEQHTLPRRLRHRKISGQHTFHGRDIHRNSGHVLMCLIL